MNFMSNKNFYQRIEHMDSKSLNDLKKSLINKNEIRAAGSSRAAYFKEPNRCESLECFSSNETLCMPKSTVSNEIYDKLKLPPALPAPEAAATTAPVNHNHSTFVDTSNSNSFVITVITEGRGYAQGEVGIASIDIHSPILLLSQFSDEVWYNGFITKINLLQPNEIIIPYTIYNTNSKIVNTIKENFSNIKLIPLPRRHFNTEDGLIMINELCSNDCKTLMKFIEKRYYTVAAASALLKYLKQIRMINFIRGGLKIEYQAKCGRMLIDHDTCHRLELLYPNCQTKQKTSCLFGILDHTVTVIGKRQLRAKILEPFFDLPKILHIQDAIKELINDPELLLILEDKLQKFWNIDKVLKIVIIESQDNKAKSVELMFDKILLLKSMLEEIPGLADCLRQCKSTIFMESYNILMDERYSVMLTTINDVIRPEVQFCRGINQYFNRIQAIQDDVDQMLDFSRSMYTKLADMIRDMIKELSIEHKLQLRMMYMTTKGFYIQLTLPKNNPDIRLPLNMTVFHRKGNVLHITTPELIKLNVRITEVVNEIYEISDKILRELICKITQYIDANHYLIGVVSNLDIFQSYAKVSLNDEFCCPDFDEETKINDAVHPLLEYSRTKSTIVRNNIIATPEYNMFIITGPNMGGKTVYIKMIATLQIMAQLGCFVPAKRAKFKLCDRIFTRIGYEDTTDQNGSSFEIELREIEYIFKNITPNSLVIVDELCRSTNPSDGKKIAKRICEKFSKLKGYKNYENAETNDNMETKSNNPLKSTTLPSQSPSSSLLFGGDNHNDKIENLTAPFIYITTHFIHLTRLSDKFLNVINLHVEAKEKFINGILNLEYTHKVKEGVTPIKGYGISLAHSVQLNESIISRAYEILNNYSEIPNENVLPTVDSSSSFFIEPIFTNLERTLNQSSTTYLLDNNVNVSVISNFMNQTNNKSQDQFLQDQNETNNLQNLSTRQLLEDVQRKFYDIYAELAEIYRSNKISSIEINSQMNDDDDCNDDDDDKMMLINQKITEIMDNLIKNLPKPLLSEIRKNKKNRNERDPCLFEKSATKETDNGMSKNATDATVTTTANSTGSTVTTAAICTVATGTCATTSVSTVIATTTATAVTATTVVNTTTAATTSDDSNVNWSKLYPDMSFHSFIRKLANGEISIPQISLNKQNPDNLQQKPDTSSSSAAPSTPSVHLKSPPSFASKENLPNIEILDNRIINPTGVNEANDNTATIPQISLNKQNRDNLQQKPSTSSLAPLVFSKSLLSSSSRKIFDSRIINPTESIANGNTVTIPQISFNQRDPDNLQQEPSTSSPSTSAHLAHLPLISSSSSLSVSSRKNLPKFPDNRIINPTETIQPIDLRALPSNHDHRQVTIIDHNIQEGALDLSKSKRDDSKSFEENNKNNEKIEQPKEEKSKEEQPKEEQPKEEQSLKLRRLRRSRRK